MDYDDSDLHSQNFHLAGEGTTKFPPVLRPYALPKFDFDDNHLRFDSLVETEVFLGIESNQDNHWIEDFSRGSSGIEFNSSAAESCSISRRNNVWSEATSSESVEMLLKSVGQEESIAAPTIIEEADACDEFGCLTKQMEHSLKHDGSILSQTKDVTKLETALPPDEIAGNSSGLKGDVGVDQRHVEDPSQNQGGESVVHGSSHNRDPNADSQKGSLHVSVGDIFVDLKCDDANRMDIDEHLDVQMQEDSFASRLRDDNLATSEQNTITSNTELNSNVQPQINVSCDENPEGHVLSKEAKMDNQNAYVNVVENTCHNENPLHSASKVETVAEISVIEANERNVEDPSSGIQKEHSELPTVAGRSKDECSAVPVEASKSEDMVLYEGTSIGGDHVGVILAIPPEALKNDVQSGRHAVEDSNTSSEMPSTLEPKTDYVESSGMEDVVESGRQLDKEILVQKSETSLSSIDVTKTFEGEGLENVTCSSAELCGETDVTGALKRVHDAVGSSRENLSAESHVLPTILVDSTQICEGDKAQGEADVYTCKRDDSVSEKENTKSPNDCSYMDSESVGKEVGSSLGESSTKNELDISTLGVTAAGYESVSDAALPKSNLASDEKGDEVSFASENGARTGVDHRDSQMSAVPVVGSIFLEVTEEATRKLLADSSVSSQVEAVSEAKEDTPRDTSGELLCKTVEQSVSTVNELTEGRGKELNISPVLFESTATDVVVTEAVALPETDKKAAIREQVLKDAANTSEPTTNKEEILAETEPLPLVEPLDRTCQNVQEGHIVTLISKDKSFKKTSESDAKNNGGSSVDRSVPTPGSPKLYQGVHGAEEGVKGSTNLNSSDSKVSDGDSGKVASGAQDSKRIDASKEGQSGSFGVSSSTQLAKRDAGKNLQSYPASSAAGIAEGSPLNSLVGQMDPKITQDISQATPQVSNVEIARGRSKGTPERKSRRSSAKATGKDNAKKGSNLKETTPAKQAERGEKSAPTGIFHVMQSNEMQHYGHVEGNNNNKPFFVLAASTSSLPDLNASASPSTVFQQPFTDFQQVQLRAQIFVYGSLIQGTAPEEAYMLSAFAGSDGGRSMWGNAWQACVERLQSQKSNPINPETPLHSRQTSTATTKLDQVSKQSAPQTQSKGLSTPVSRSSTKSSQTIVSPMIPLSSPLWSLPTPVGDGMQSGVMPRGSVMDYQQAVTPMHPFQTPPIRNLLGHNTSWMSQVPFRGPWVPSPQPSVPEASIRFTAFPNTEPVQLTPVKDTTVPHSSGTKHVSSSPMVQTGALASVFTTAAPVVDLKKVTSSPGQHSADTKPRKRKKNQASEQTSQVILQSQSKPEALFAPVVFSNLTTSVAITSPASFVSQAMPEKLVVSATPTPSSDSLRKADHDVVQKAILSEETHSKIKEASKQAEDAAAPAAAAVGYSQEIWGQLEKRKTSGLVSDVEAKLASAAVAVAAAAAVAKAAAAVANVASNAALQAKLMADEAFVSHSFENPSQSTRISFSERVNEFGKATPASILRGEDGANSSSSIITAAREAARRKVEAASAASKRAENMDAIVKAAELAAEAVSQAGKIVAMGDTLPLNELIEAGPEGYWRAPQLSSEWVAKSTEITREQSRVGGVGEGANFSAKNSKDGRLGKKETQTTVNEKSSISREVTKESMEEHLRLVDGISGSVIASERESRGQKGHKVSDLTKNIVVVLESETIPKSSSINVENDVEKAAEVLKENNIKEGSKVEVFKDGDGFKAAWYTANVLSLNDGKACVSYTEIEQDGLAQLQEWVALEGEGDDRPKIRIARPVTAVRYEGTRKRRRAAMGDYNWSVGDRVDAWMTNSWWEGVVTEKNKKDETSVTVHFPAQGETSVVKAWHLRPSLIWKDGEWAEWSNLRNDSSPHEGDIPQEKRLKLGSPAMEAKGKDKIEKSTDNLDAGKLEESRILDLAATEKRFNVGKSTRNVSKPDAPRMVRTGLQKQGSGVIFGVPKPGKKRKFMEVSKYNVADQSNKNIEANDSLKYLKYMAPQGPGSRGLKNDPKEKRIAESKLKGLKSGKPQAVSGRTVLQRENFSTSAISTSGDSTAGDHTGNAKDSLSNVDNLSRKQNLMETVSFSGSVGPAETPFIFASLAPALDGPSKKISTSTAKSERANKGKLAPASGKLGKIEEDKVFNGNTTRSTSEVVEPRRSNRRIQPTSRLLEGLQSSLIIPKFPSVSHDKGHRVQNKSTSRG
ncbi:hypothetical protein L484_024094 [Morus notabilis]|uniref:Agenet domain-containing protein n=2 Tax=Morus notabilis TaxID=981085 RepID=W9RXY7_9ROSA|nr:hypothetical protein L484_024094 [Morus notabilis]